MKAEHHVALRDGVVEALERGLDLGGASIDDYRDAKGEKGGMQNEFLVHRREGEDCITCGGEIQRIVVGGRSTYFCPNCQKRLRRKPRRNGAKKPARGL
jgi:formamidopyrimidine-DNA glycosylase